MGSLIYVYPRYRDLSFTLIAKEHIARLGKLIKIHEVNETALDSLYWIRGKKVLLHPILYVTIGDRKEMFGERFKRLERLLKVKDKLGGFDTCDTDAISDVAVKVLNMLDLIFVPSSWARDVYIKCGVKTKVEVLPHGLPDELLNEYNAIDFKPLVDLRQLKEKKRLRLVLYFLTHSGFRKGADVVYKAMSKVQEKRKNVVLVVKRASIIDPYLGLLKKLRMIEIAGFFSKQHLAQLYDLCDIVLVPSRGGGFELNALEAIARGRPTLVTAAGCFLDYIDFAIPIRVKGKAKIFEDNPIHVGYGYEPDENDLAQKVLEVLDHYDEYQERFTKNAAIVRQQYSWNAICCKLHSKLMQHGFIELDCNRKIIPKEVLLQEHKKVHWGCLLCFPDEFFWFSA